jgi:hypothetical protein
VSYGPPNWQPYFPPSLGRAIGWAAIVVAVCGLAFVAAMAIFDVDWSNLSYEHRMHEHRCRQLGEGHRGDANYRTALDANGDGISCEGQS